MHTRDATEADFDAVRAVARRSLHASYDDLLDPDDLDDAAADWYASDRLAEQIESDEAAVILAVSDDEVVGFAQCELHTHEDWTDGRILWLHVDPAHRGAGAARTLLETAEDRLDAAGADRVSGAVLAGHEAGTEFYRHNGYEGVDEREVTVGDRSLRERVFVRESDDIGDVALDAIETPEGRVVYVDEDEADRGSKGPFYRAYTDREADQPWGWICGHCGSADVAMNTMGKALCNDCENTRKATRWDSAYM